MKKLLSVLLAVICVLTMSNAVVPAFAENGSEVVMSETDRGESQETPEEPTEPELPDEPAPKLSDYEYVVTMYICSTASSFTGHVWLYFVNLTECEVPLGNIMLKPGEGMSVGSLSYFRKGGGGTYYNAEARMATQKGVDTVCSQTNSLQMDLTESQLDIVNKKIKSMDFYMYTLWNCGCFATQVWNSVSDKDVVHIVLPIFTVLNMRILGAQKGVLKMQEVTDVYKQTKSGYEELKNHSFNSLCV